MPTVDWWLARNHHRTHKGNALDLDAHPWQRALLQDESRNKVIRKSVQCGVSECVCVSAFACVDRGERVFWVFPTESIRNRFVAERLDPCVKSCPRYTGYALAARSRLRGGRSEADATSLKQFGDAAIAFVGSNSPASFAEFVADWVFVDELDHCDQDMLTRAKDRMGHSNVRGMYRVGNPSLVGYGIDELYTDSDRKRWHVTCTHCGDRQTLDWFVNFIRQIDQDRYELRATDGAVCRTCNGAIDRHSNGEWIADIPGADISGYHVSQLFSGTLTIDDIWKHFQRGLKNQTEMMAFYNAALGEGYKHADAKLYPELVQRCVGQHAQANVGNDCLIGVDPGREIHGVIGFGNKVVRIFALEGESKWRDLQNILNAYGAIAAIDADYDPTEVRRFQEANKGRVYLVSYRSPGQVADYDLDSETRFVKADRTQTMDESHAAILAGDLSLPRDAMSISGFVDQLCTPTRVLVERKLQSGLISKIFVWVDSDKPDHWRHALNYWWLLRKVTGDGHKPFLYVLGQHNRGGPQHG
jgi:hypothetical protein